MKSTCLTSHGSSRFASVKGILYRVVHCLLMISSLCTSWQEAGRTQTVVVARFYSRVISDEEASFDDLPISELSYRMMHRPFMQSRIGQHRRCFGCTIVYLKTPRCQKGIPCIFFLI